MHSKNIENNIYEIDKKDYPSLSMITNKIHKSKNKKFINNKKIIKYIISSSYLDSKSINCYDPRSKAFSNMKDKNILTKNLTCTRPCSNVKRDSIDKEFGICNRVNCSFAHCLDDLNDPMCGFDANCRIRWGKENTKNNIRDPKTRCTFRHSDETRQDWTKRTGRIMPDLPITRDKSVKSP
jgi:hypothetical protein